MVEAVLHLGAFVTDWHLFEGGEFVPHAVDAQVGLVLDGEDVDDQSIVLANDALHAAVLVEHVRDVALPEGKEHFATELIGADDAGRGDDAGIEPFLQLSADGQFHVGAHVGQQVFGLALRTSEERKGLFALQFLPFDHGAPNEAGVLLGLRLIETAVVQIPQHVGRVVEEQGHLAD
ncbi:MAG: hypothetical protein JWN64_323 [Parcubacteria group bacterium]|nr:hypothetical protein [Parcubacteria group bacterium]